MQIGVPRETHPDETRVPLVPQGVRKLVGLGMNVEIEAGMGVSAGFPDEEYVEFGATVSADRAQVLAREVVLRLRKPEPEDVGALAADALHVSYLDPFNDKPLVQALAAQGARAVCMEMIPRSTRAQKMDALSSQANLGGYAAVIQASYHLNKIFPMMMTPAGTISPAKVFVIGAGVAGLQAIATAKRLGARVEAFDTRPVVAEQVRSLGARFVEIDLGETGQTEQGYARELTPEQLELQRQGQAKVIAASDVVITTAQVFGRPAPRIVSRDMVEAMRPGSVVVDMAVETGGNVEGSVAGEVVEINGVKVVGQKNLPADVARNASEMYSANLVNLLEEFWDKEAGTLELPADDDIVKSCLLTRGGEIVNETIRNLA